MNPQNLAVFLLSILITARSFRVWLKLAPKSYSGQLEHRPATRGKAGYLMLMVTKSQSVVCSKKIIRVSDLEEQLLLAPTMETKVQILKDYSSKKQMFSSQASNLMLNLLEKYFLDKVPSHKMADFLWSISGLGIKMRNPRDRKFLLSILQTLSEVAHQLDATEASRCFVALYRLEIDFQQLTSETIQSSILMMIDRNRQQFKALQIVNVIFAMSKMKIHFSVLSFETQRELTNTIIREQSFIMRQSQLMNMLLYGLALSSYPLTSFNDLNIEGCISKIALSLLRSTNESSTETQHLANAIYALNKLGFKHSTCDLYSNGEISGLVWQGVLSKFDRMKDQEAAMTLHGLGGLGYHFNNITSLQKDLLLTQITLRLPSLNSQAFDMAFGGLVDLGLKWLGTASKKNSVIVEQQVVMDLQKALETAIETQFSYQFNITYLSSSTNTSHSSNKVSSPHLIALVSILASMAKMDVYWPTLSEPVREAVISGIRRYAGDLDVERICSLLTSLGMMSATYFGIGFRIIDPLTSAIERLQNSFSQASLCQLMHGFSRMRATWVFLPPRVQNAIVNNLQSQVTLGSICLPCTFYTLGLMSADWKELPMSLKDKLLVSMNQPNILKDRVLANLVYGLSLMKITWDGLEPSFQDIIANSFGVPDALGSHPGHVFMVFCGLGRISTDWTTLPHTDELQFYFRQTAPQMSASELCGCVHGMAYMHVAWKQLEPTTRALIETGLEMHLNHLSFQELGNIMVALALMTFDYDFSAEDLHLFRIFTALAYKYRTLMRSYTKPSMEGYHQMQIYFEFLATFPLGQKIISNVFGKSSKEIGTRGFIPKIAGPSPTIPSATHARLMHWIKEYILKEFGEEIELQHEFNGLNGVYPVDCAIWQQNQLLAFVEVDGEHHYYTVDGVENLYRKNKLKEWLYAYHFPDVPFYRVNVKEIQEKGFERVAKQIAIKLWNARPADTIW